MKHDYVDKSLFASDRSFVMESNVRLGRVEVRRR